MKTVLRDRWIHGGLHFLTECVFRAVGPSRALDASELTPIVSILRAFYDHQETHDWQVVFHLSDGLVWRYHAWHPSAMPLTEPTVLVEPAPIVLTRIALELYAQSGWLERDTHALETTSCDATSLRYRLTTRETEKTEPVRMFLLLSGVAPWIDGFFQRNRLEQHVLTWLIGYAYHHRPLGAPDPDLFWEIYLQIVERLTERLGAWHEREHLDPLRLILHLERSLLGVPDLFDWGHWLVRQIPPALLGESPRFGV